jgi:hypothetical protein
MPYLQLHLPLLHPLYLRCQARRLPLQLLQDFSRLLVALPLLPQLPPVALLLVGNRCLLLLLLAKRVLQGLQVREGRAGTAEEVQEQYDSGSCPNTPGQLESFRLSAAAAPAGPPTSSAVSRRCMAARLARH